MPTKAHRGRADTHIRFLGWIWACVVSATLLMGGCVQDDLSFDSIFGPGRSKLACEDAVWHPFPDVAGDFQNQPSGSGHVPHYGGYPESYAGSPEVIWEVDLTEGGSYNFYMTFDDEDDLDLMILDSCDVGAVKWRLSRDEGGVEQGNRVLDAGKYFLVADGKDGRFAGGWVVLQIVKL